MTDLDNIRLSVNNELGDQIVAAWLKQHLSWAQDSFDKAIHEEDKSDARADILAFRRVLNYAGGNYDRHSD